MHRAAAKETTSSIWSLETRQECFEPTLLANINETIVRKHIQSRPYDSKLQPLSMRRRR
jgi:hypothetical protein